MSLPNLKRMTAEEYAVWSGRQERGRFELIDGLLVEMNAEQADRARVKMMIAFALHKALTGSRWHGEVFGDGMAVQISERIVHEPDAMVRLGG